MRESEGRDEMRQVVLSMGRYGGRVWRGREGGRKGDMKSRREER